MLGKVLARLKEYPNNKKQRDVLAWCKAKAENHETFLAELDKTLWEETKTLCSTLKQDADTKLSKIDMHLGGGGHYPLLYFLTRYLSAKTVVETGVAAGWSSQAILTALKHNNNGGRLYSSDFPYFRCESPEKLIGFVVDEELKENWNLYIDGDQNNLPQIVSKIEEIDLFHYDSDKSYAGRARALDIVRSRLDKDAVILFDDIQDNFHFRDYVQNEGAAYKVLEFEGKYVGFVAPFIRKNNDEATS